MTAAHITGRPATLLRAIRLDITRARQRAREEGLICVAVYRAPGGVGLLVLPWPVTPGEA